MKIIRAKEADTSSRTDGRTVRRMIDFNFKNPADSVTLFICELPDGKFGDHKHTVSDEFICFPQGGKITINGESFDMNEWDIALLEKGDIHGNEEGCGPIIHFAIKAPTAEDKVNC